MAETRALLLQIAWPAVTRASLMAWQIPVPASDHELQNILSREQNADGIPTACSSMKDHGIIQGRPKVYAINRRSQVLPTNDFSDAWRDLNHAKTWKRARRSTTLQLLRFSCSRPMSPMPRPAKFQCLQVPDLGALGGFCCDCKAF